MSFDIFNPTEEHKMLRDMVKDFTASKVEPQAFEYDKKEEFNLELFRSLGELGLLGVTVSDEFGGSGMDATAAVIAHEEIAYSDPGFCLAYLAHSMLCVNNLYVNGSQKQKEIYLPKLCSGEWVGAMGMSEPHVGTDVLGMKTSVKKESGFYNVNGQKMWITNGCTDEKGTPADVVLIYGITNQPEGKRPEISTFVIQKGDEGYSVGQKIQDKLGMRASNTAELVFTNCKLTEDRLVGEEGDSLGHMMRNLEVERLTLAAISLGIARRSLDVMVRYAKDRQAFGKSLNRFGQIQRFIGESYAEYKAASAYVYQTALGVPPEGTGKRLDSDGVKLFAATVGKNIADRAIQVLGGYGYVGEYHVERLWRDAKLIEIGGGTLEAHHKNITADLSKQL